MRIQRSLTLVSVMSVILVVGCASTDDGSKSAPENSGAKSTPENSGTDSAPENSGANSASEKGALTITETDAVQGRFAGTFAHQGRTIGFEAVRGEENPADETQSDPNAPRFAVDVRFMDVNGNTFILSGGGEVDQPGATDNDAVAPEERAHDLALLPLLSDELQTAGTPDGLDFEFQKVVQLAEELRDVELIAKPTSNVLDACTTGYLHRMTVRYTTAFGQASLGQHTAVYLSSWYQDSSCATIYQGYQESCNHGTCATASSMSDWCSWESPLRSYRWPAFQVHFQFYMLQGSGACSSYYNPFSVLGGHNCNDDTYFQIHNILNNSYYDSASGPNDICKDDITHSHAPSCTGAHGAL